MHISIAAIGKSKQSLEEQLAAEYLRRLPWRVELLVNDGRKLKNAHDETAWLLEASHGADILYALDERGKDLGSVIFANQLKKQIDGGARHIAFIIGGADGLEHSQLPKHMQSICFGRMTWPHMLVRAMLAEQLYRASTIISGHPYHRS